MDKTTVVGIGAGGHAKVILDILIQRGSYNIRGLVDKNPKTCKAIWDKLPLELRLTRWGEELYGWIDGRLRAGRHWRRR